MLVLVPPVDGPVVRPFVYAGSPFQRGLHRGVDLRARRGDRVVAPCGGDVAYAGRFGVTLRCGRHRVTVVAVVPDVGRQVAAGAPIGRARGDVHLGVRRATDAFGYVDPAGLLRRSRPAPPVTVGPRPRLRSLPPRAPPPQRAPSERAAPLAPWPAWAGLVLLLLAAARVVASSRAWPSMSRRRSSTSTRRRTSAMRTR